MAGIEFRKQHGNGGCGMAEQAAEQRVHMIQWRRDQQAVMGQGQVRHT